jgi:hypothetical protein
LTVAKSKREVSEAVPKAEIGLKNWLREQLVVLGISVFASLAQNHAANRFPMPQCRLLFAELSQFQERRVQLGPAAVAQVFQRRFNLPPDRGISLVKKRFDLGRHRIKPRLISAWEV